jgi:GNAT superfamily N-acetyltransferase
MIVRDAVPDDAAAIADVHVRSWQSAYRGLLPENFLDQLRAEDRAAGYELGSLEPRAPKSLIAMLGERVAGFTTIGPSRDADAASAGELRALYVDPDYWRGGVGRALLLEARRRLREAGYHEALLWVLDGNTIAERFYRADGWQPDGATREEDPVGRHRHRAPLLARPQRPVVIPARTTPERRRAALRAARASK